MIEELRKEFNGLSETFNMAVTDIGQAIERAEEMKKDVVESMSEVILEAT